MTLEDVQNRIAAIFASKGDDEMAHAMEDDLYYDVLRAIALADIPLDEVRAIAAKVTTTRDIDFQRWFA